MPSQEKSAFLGFTKCLLADESDCTEHKDDPWVSKVIEA